MDSISLGNLFSLHIEYSINLGIYRKEAYREKANEKSREIGPCLGGKIFWF
jgi:hypothetical protein